MNTITCKICGTTENLARHHVFYGSANRKKSEQYKDICVVWLCAKHHNMSSHSVHMDRDMDLALKKETQKRFEEKYGHDKFMEVFHRNYLEEKT